MRSFYEGDHYLYTKWMNDRMEELIADELTVDELIARQYSSAEEAYMRYPDVPNEEMKKVKEKFDSSSKYALCLCTQQTVLIVGSEKIPACYH